jgi:spermidine/putrescine transport system substrate-binding protein
MEGAMAWVDGMSMPKGAKNIDQVYAFVEYDYTPEASGSAVSKHGYNSPVVGAAKFAGEQYAKNFAEAYPEDALDRLNPWPAEAPWYADIRAQYVEKFQAA